MPGKVPPGVAFSLVCERCDAAIEIETHEQAMNEGWTDISPSANFIGLCPDCRRAEES
jgi:Fe2+ or Zn2+ uptake regulation protein